MIDRKRTQRKEKIQLLQALLLRGHCSALNLNEAQKKTSIFQRERNE